MVDREEPGFAIFVTLLIFSMNSAIVHVLAVLYHALERLKRTVAPIV